MYNSKHIINSKFHGRLHNKKHSFWVKLAEKSLKYMIILVIVTGLLTPFNLGNSFLRASDFEDIIVHKGDNLWLIAEKYTRDSTLKEELVEAIVEINNLSIDGKIYPGQKLYIPIIKREEVQMANSES